MNTDNMWESSFQTQKSLTKARPRVPKLPKGTQCRHSPCWVQPREAHSPSPKLNCMSGSLAPTPGFAEAGRWGSKLRQSVPGSKSWQEHRLLVQGPGTSDIPEIKRA